MEAAHLSEPVGSVRENVAELSPDTAEDMVHQLFEDDEPAEGDRILIPGLGHGRLVECIDSYCQDHNCAVPTVVVFETNSELAERGYELTGIVPVEIHQNDFLLASDVGDFEYVLGDPPVVRATQLSEEYYEDIATRLSTFSTRGVTSDADLYIAFFDQALRHLTDGGRLVFVTPDFTENEQEGAVAALKRRLSDYRIDDIDEVVETRVTKADIDTIITTIIGGEPDESNAISLDLEGAQEALVRAATYSITAEDLMTADLYTAALTDDVQDVYLDLIKGDYDAAPVRDPDTGEYVGIVSRAALTTADTGTIADGEHYDSLDEGRTLDPNASAVETLDALSNARYHIVGTSVNVEGIVTRFDLNSINVYLHLYAKLARFEIGLRSAIRDHEVDWEAALLEGGMAQKELKRRKQRHEPGGSVTRDELDALLLSDLITIVQNTDIGTDLEFDTLPNGGSLEYINDLRGDVAHYQPLVHTMKSISFSDGRTAPGLYEVYTGMEKCLDTLDAAGYLATS